MARRATPLTARQVASAKPGVYGDGNGLFLRVKDSGARSWEVRYQLPSQQRRAAGIGGVDKPYSLAEAREKAFDIQRQAKRGIDPLVEKARKRAIKAAPVATFRFCAEAYIAGRAPTWKNLKHAAQWPATLERYAYPVLGNKPVQDITASDVLAVLQPIWLTTPETASRVRNRIEAVLDWAIAMDHRVHSDNPARWGGKLKMLLPTPSKAAEAVRRESGRDEHFAAMPWQELPSFIARLRQYDNLTARALEFVILTAARTDMVRAATWDEVNLDERVWTIPAARMKMGRLHRVPLSDRAMAILAVQREYSEYARTPFVFSGVDPARPIHSNTMYQLLRQYMGFNTITVHGFRSTFRQWAADTNRSDAAAEMALAHTLGKVEAAYQRSDLLEERRVLVEAWSKYMSGDAVVVPIRVAS